MTSRLRHPQPPTDGWVGTRELPGYRAGRVVVKLDDLPGVDPDHLYCDLLLLDDGGRPEDTDSGPCQALARRRSLDERSQFVRVVAELVRHAPSPERGLTAIGPALSFIRECGLDPRRLTTAVQLLDNACTESAVAASLSQVLELSLGEDEARRTLADIVVRLARTSGFAAMPADRNPPQGSEDFDSRVDAINRRGMAAQMDYVVRTVGKARVRRYLRDMTDFELLPRPDMFGV